MARLMSEAPSAPIVILMGRSAYAREMARIYVDAFGRQNLRIVEEVPSASTKLIKFLRARIRNRGLLSALDAVALRILMVLHRSRQERFVISPDLTVNHVDDPAVAELVMREHARIVILDVCSLLSAEQIARIRVPIINVHNGIAPRYRGAGNLWALAEDNPGMIGATLHWVDAGVHTGTRLSVARFDPVKEVIPFSDVDLEAFKRGAQLAVDFVRTGEGQIPPECSVLPDRYYPFPGLTDWLRARRNFHRRAKRRADAPIEHAWQTSFKERAADKTLTVPEKLHWSDTASVGWRDAAIADIVRQNLPPHGLVLDLGCGDARLAEQFGDSYVGCDYSESTLRLAPPGVRCVVASAGALPFCSEVFDVSLAVGLLACIEDAQSVADELLRVTRAGGTIVINTLRQFSRAELLVVAAASLFSPTRLALVRAIWRREHGVVRGGTLVGRRYSVGELRRLFPRGTGILSIAYHGAKGFVPFAREITVSFRVPQPRSANKTRSPQAAGSTGTGQT
jgi:SAM-dependent methyltransferase